MPNNAQSKDILREDEILIQAGALASRGRWPEAASLLRGVQLNGTLSVSCLGRLAFYCSRVGDYDGAITLYQSLCEQQPYQGKWFYALGFQYQQQKRWVEAIKAYERRCQLAPQWLLPMLRLGDVYQATQESEKAMVVYRKGIQDYQAFSADRRSELVTIYAKLCARAARVLLSRQNRDQEKFKEAVKLLQESISIDSNDADNWYRLGCALLELERVDESLDCLQKAETLGPKKEYISHKIAQAYLKKDNPDQALKAYERIPHYRQSPYILHGMAQCYTAKGEPMEAARRLHQATQREPGKFYHHWDFALALIALGAKDQAIEALESANQLFRQEYGKDYQKALAKMKEIQSTLAAGKQVSFEELSTTGAGFHFGKVVRYDAKRGFGFIKDDADGIDVFFHITRIKEKAIPQVGARTKYLREVGEKGFQAAKVWVMDK
jgi:tetratricopeptide (TPR) repeat protein